MEDITTSEPNLGWPADADGLTGSVGCEHCGAALDERQRYCVVCGGRRSDADNPAVRYFAAAAQRDRGRRLGAEAESPAGALPRLAAALVLAVLPLAVGVGVLLGRGNGSSLDPRLLAALRAQPAEVAAAAPTGATGAAGAPQANATNTAGGQVLSRTSLGAAHQIAGYHPSAAQTQRDAQVVNRINREVGKSYVSAQRNLPDAIVVGGSGGTNAGPSQGPGQP